MLLVDDYIRKVLELYRLLYQRVRAYYHRYFTICDPFQQLRARNIGGFVGRHFRGKFFTTTPSDERDVDG